MIREAIGRVKTTVRLLTKSELDATDILRSDHMKAEAMLLQLRFVKDANTRRKTLAQIQSDLLKHMRIEETILYPVAETIERVMERIEHAYHQHEEIRQVMSRLSSMNPSSTNYSKTVTQFIKTLENHVMEEEDKIFPMVRSNLDELTLRRLDREILQAHGAPLPMHGTVRVTPGARKVLARKMQDRKRLRGKTAGKKSA